MQDQRGLTITTSVPTVVTQLATFQQQFLGYGPDVTVALDAAAADPECGYAQACCAMLQMFLESGEAPALARPYLVQARRQRAAASEREQWFIDAVGAWVEADMPRALALHEVLAERYPRDLAAVKLGQYHYFNVGDAPGMLRLALKARTANADDPYLHGLLAFALEECHVLEAAEQAARTAIRLQRAEPWAHHALAHVLETQGRIAEGIDFMESVSATWEGLNSFMHSHNWWHLCLYYLDSDQPERVLAVYDDHIWGLWKDYSQDQIGAVSLLARLELHGVEVGEERWQELADHLVGRTEEHVQPFLDLQYLYGLARAGRAEAQTMATGIERYASTAPDFVRPIWQIVAVPLARALVAYSEGDSGYAVRAFETALPRLREIGGSHAQRGLFGRLYLSALLRAGHYVQAQQDLALRYRARPQVGWIRRQLEDVHQALGLPARLALQE